jgi:hypothetical protein
MGGRSRRQTSSATEEGRRTGLNLMFQTLGEPIPRVLGMHRLACKVIWSLPLRESVSDRSSGSRGRKKGSKKGGGGLSIIARQYEYYFTGCLAICEGPIDAIRRIWIGGELVVDLSDKSLAGKSAKYDPAVFRFYMGSEDQMPDPEMEAVIGVGKTPAHRGLAYVRVKDLPLGLSKELPQIEVEVIAGSKVDSYATDGVELPIQGVETWANDKWELDPVRPYVWGLSSGTGGKLFKVNRITGVLEEDCDITDDAFLDGYREANPGTANVPSFISRPVVNPADGAVFACLNASSVGTVVEIDGDTCQPKGFLRLGSLNLFDHGSVIADMIVLAGSTTGATVYAISKEAIRAGTLDVAGTGSGSTSGTLGAVTTYGKDSYGLPTYAELALQGTATTNIMAIADSANLVRALVISIRNSPVAPDTWINDVGFDGGVTLSSHRIGDISPLLEGMVADGAVFDTRTRCVILVMKRVSDGSGFLASVDIATWSLVKLSEANVVGGGFNRSMIYSQPTVEGAVVLQLGNLLRRIDTRDLSVIREWNVPQNFGPFDLNGAFYDPLLAAVWSNSHGVDPLDAPTKLFLDRFGDGKVTIGTICADICRRAGLEQNQIDVSELAEDVVTGYRVEFKGTAAAEMKPIKDAFFFDVLETDYKLKFVKRNKELVDRTFDEGELVPTSEEDRDPIAVTIAQAAELPKSVTVLYSDSANSFQKATQTAATSENLTVENSVTHDLTRIAMDGNLAAKVVHVGLHEALIERTTATFTMNASNVDLDPGDIVRITRTDSQKDTLSLRIRKMTLGTDFSIETEATLADTRVYDTASVVAAKWKASRPQVIPWEVDSTGFFLNLPCLGPEDANQGGFLWAAAPMYRGANMSWQGAALLRSTDGVAYEPYAATDVGCIWGKTRSILKTNPRYGVWDDESVLEVRLFASFDLQTRPDIDVLNGANTLIVGDEIIQFGKAESIGKTTWRLSHILRGRYGTDWAVNEHVLSENVLVFDRAAFQRLSSVEDRAKVLTYQTVSLSQTAPIPQKKTFINTSEALRPYSPVHAKVAYDSGRNAVCTWIRRTRHSGQWTDGIGEVPLNEQVERYAVDVSDASGILRTITVSAPSCSYSHVDYLADVGGNVARLFLTNPGSELGLKGWTVETGSFQTYKSYSGDTGNVGPSPSGNAWFWHAGNAATCRMSQMTSLSDAAFMEDIEAGSVTCTVTVNVVSTAPDDTATLGLKFFLEDGTPISQHFSTPTSPAVVGVWQTMTFTAAVPATARKAQVNLTANRVAGTANNIAFDGVSLRLDGTRSKVVFSISQISAVAGLGRSRRVR